MDIMQQDSRSPFNYEPLEDGDIRLLYLTAAHPNDGLISTMVASSLDETIQFYALSYFWGSHIRSRSIICNGKILKITESQFGALSSLKDRLLDERLPLWIDGICIDQEDKNEKAHQVTRMHTIYRQAKGVIIWVGPEADDSTLAIAFLEEYAEALLAFPGIPMPNILERHGFPRPEDQRWKAVGCLFSRPWFFRLWTMQEIILARTAFVQCGNVSVAWRKVEAMGYSIHFKKLWPITVSVKTRETQFRGFTSVANLAITRKNMEVEASRKEFVNFSNLLQAAFTKQCTEQRDRVYALLGLTTENFRRDVPVDYEIPLEELYIQCGKAALKNDPYLYYLQLIANQPRRSGLPSWCLNLDPRANELIFGRHLRAGLSKNKPTSAYALVGFTRDSREIGIQGFRADLVSQVVPTEFVWTHHATVERAKNLGQWEEKCRLLACDSVGVPRDDVPLAHVCTLAASIKDEEDDIDGLMSGYRDQIAHLASQAQGRGNQFPPSERLSAFEDFWIEMVRVCPGRVYFSTESGRVGIGPPAIRAGDRVVVFYGARPVFILRDCVGSGTEMEIVGDAFVHGLMDLDKTPRRARGTTEAFVIC